MLQGLGTYLGPRYNVIVVLSVAVSMTRVFHICSTHTIVVMVGFEQSSYTVGETSPVLDVCVRLSGALFSTTTMLRTVTLRVASQGVTATGYIPPLPHTHTCTNTYVHTHAHTHIPMPTLN